jgi:hypothetical protein
MEYLNYGTEIAIVLNIFIKSLLKFHKMKSKLFLLLLFVGLGTFTLSAQAEGAVSNTLNAQDNMVEVTVDQLPAAVQTTLKSETYKNWTVSKAYHVKGENEHYVIHAEAGGRDTKIKLDKDGNVVE